jgi:hypothetical protein
MGHFMKWVHVIFVIFFLQPTEMFSQTAPMVFMVSTNGNDSGDGSPAHPFRTLERAQQAVRLVNRGHDVEVRLGNGIYRLTRTLRFSAEDGGQNGHHVLWTAVPGACPVISGAVKVTGWKLYDQVKQIYVASTPVGVDTRELWVNGHLAPVAQIEIPRDQVEFTRDGILLKDPRYEYLSRTLEQDRMEVRATGFFTLRISPVEKISGGKIVMKQPAWRNNLWGYDTIEAPFHPELAHLYLANSLAFLKQPGQWYLDPAAGQLYLRLPPDAAPETMDVELPQLAVLMSLGGSLDAPLKDLSFHGIRFSHTSWLGPSTSEGYASQQSGAYLAGHALLYPQDPIVDCARGCREFESMRNEWNQMPASIQISAAQRITFDHCIFAHLGQYALGIGNDADAMFSGTGLGASDITISANVFTDIAGGAILAGGVQRDAHHPRDPRMINRQIIIRDNLIDSVSEDYQDNSAILSTYVAGAIILHNEILHVPYDAIDIGYGWGIQDPGGNPNYRIFMHGYDFPQNKIYDIPTTHHDVVVAGNRIHDAKKLFHDGGAIYNLSASPGTIITENFIYDNHGRVGLYLDEGSRYLTLRNNVVRDPNGEWLNINTVHHAYPLRISIDNLAIDNWHDSNQTGGMWTNYENDLILQDHFITNGEWPVDAKRVMREAGVEKLVRLPLYQNVRPDWQ